VVEGRVVWAVWRGVKARWGGVAWGTRHKYNPPDQRVCAVSQQHVPGNTRRSATRYATPSRARRVLTCHHKHVCCRRTPSMLQRRVFLKVMPTLSASSAAVSAHAQCPPSAPCFALPPVTRPDFFRPRRAAALYKRRLYTALDVQQEDRENPAAGGPE